MGYYRSEKEAVYFALLELKKYVPAKWTNEGIEWGTVIYRCEDEEARPWYTYINPFTDNITRFWQPPPPARWNSGWREAAYCHTHPNDTGFSEQDLSMIYQVELVTYMVTQSGAYSYNATPDYKSFGKYDLIRYGTVWGKPYPWNYLDPRKLRQSSSAE